MSDSDSQKKSYKKPEAADVGKTAPVLGACTPGGNDPTVIPTCSPNGATATGSCVPGGNAGFGGVEGGNCSPGLVARDVCYSTGGTAAFSVP